MEQSSRAVEGPLDATVVPLDPKRAAFEAWCCRRWAGDRGGLARYPQDHERHAGQYRTGAVEFAWCAWQAAQ